MTLPKVYKLKYVCQGVDPPESSYKFAAVLDVHSRLVLEGQSSRSDDIADQQTEKNPVYFIDLMPDAGWPHPCLYVRMGTFPTATRYVSSDPSVEQHSYPPHADNVTDDMKSLVDRFVDLQNALFDAIGDGAATVPDHVRDHRGQPWRELGGSMLWIDPQHGDQQVEWMEEPTSKSGLTFARCVDDGNTFWLVFSDEDRDEERDW